LRRMTTSADSGTAEDAGDLARDIEELERGHAEVTIVPSRTKSPVL
jgi:hypothetical protein